MAMTLPVNAIVWASHKVSPDNSAHKQGRITKPYKPTFIGSMNYMPMREIAPVPQEYLSQTLDQDYPNFWIDTRSLVEETIPPANENLVTDETAGHLFVALMKWAAHLFKQ